MERLELADVQGLVARGYGNLRAARYALLEIVRPAAAGAWLGALWPELTSAEARPQARALNLAFTPSGLSKLGLGAALEQFSNEFASGMVTPHRRRLLGDVEQNAPELWRWGGPANRPVDALLMLFAADRDELARLYGELSRQLDGAGVRELLLLETSDLDDTEQFGFRDGVSQPIVEGFSKTGPPEQTVKAGEFLLGYLNEYGRRALRPMLDRSADPAGLLPVDRASGRADFGRNGSYLVFRQLEQDVRGFWRFVDEATRRPDGSSDVAARLWLASKMVGRWPSGAPLALAPEQDDPALADANDFGYHQADPYGLRCPIGAHVRRANPRDSLDPEPGSEKSYAINKRHRILRRGREYGPSLAPAELWGAPPAGAGTTPGPAVATRERRAAQARRALANAEAAQAARPALAEAGEPERGLPQFVTVRGGGYFFLPGLRAIRYLAATSAGRPT